MVLYSEIQASNALINDSTAPKVAIFIGGTSGIGKLTLKALVSTGASLRIYLIGRKATAQQTQPVIQELNAINPKAEIIWTQGEVSLLAETRRICEHVKSVESQVDLVFLTTGYAPFGPRRVTSEGLEVVQSLEYYTRMLAVIHLLPLLHAAEAPRVVSVLGGGMERSCINVDDLDLEKAGNFSGFRARPQYIAMDTMGLEKLAVENPDVTFIHSCPGLVSTGNVRRGRDPNSITAWLVWLLAEPLIWLLSMNDEESAQRNFFQCTSAAFGGRGVPWTGKEGVNSKEERMNGLFLVNYKCECTPNAKVLTELREKAQEKIWDHTQRVLRPYL